MAPTACAPILAQYLTLIFGLPMFPMPFLSQILLFFVKINLMFQGHDIVNRLGIWDSTTWNGCSGFKLHHEDWLCSNSQKQLDTSIAVKSDGHLQVTNTVDRYLHSDLLLMSRCAMVTADCNWGQMECWKNCVWKPYSQTGQRGNVQEAWEQLCCYGHSSFPIVLAVLEALAPSLRDSYVIWLFLNFDSMILSGNLLTWHWFPCLLLTVSGQVF